MGLFDNIGNIAGNLLQNPLIQQDMQNRQLQHIQKVFAANPQYAEKLYGTLTKMNGGGGETPSDIKTALYLKQHPELQDLFFKSKRAQQLTDIGDQVVRLDPMTGLPTYYATKQLAPADQPLNAGAKSAAQEAGKLGQQLEVEPLITAENKRAELAASKDSALEESLAKIKEFKSSVSRFKDTLANTEMTGIGGALLGGVTSDAGRMDLVSAQNELTLRAKDLLGMPSANFSDADRDFITAIAGGKFGSKTGLGRVAERLNRMADQQAESITKRITKGANQATSALPPGAVVIGTSGGKKVYQLPDGSHVMEQ